MAGNGSQDDPLLRRLRIIAIGVFIVLSAVLVIAQVLGRALIGPGYDVGEVLIGAIVGMVPILLGIPAIVRYINGPPKDQP